MKKIILALAMLGWVLGATAQEERLTIERVKKGEEPRRVMDAIQQDFPKAISKNLSFLPAKLYGEEWNVNLTGDREADIKYYQVDIKQGNRYYTAVYDANGKLMSSKQMVHDVKLPGVVSETLKKFEGWHIDSTHEIVKYAGGKHASDIYRVKLQKGAEHKIVYLDANGNIINTRFAII